jgi:hypothetical protein
MSIIQHSGEHIKSYIKDIVSVGWQKTPIPASTKERTMTRYNEAFSFSLGVRQNVRTVNEFRPIVVNEIITLIMQAVK